MSKSKAWRCEVCGHIHYGEMPPEHCPVCGVPANMFKQVEQQNETSTEDATLTDGTTSWRCSVCGYIHYGEMPPDHCPVCGVPASEFEAIESKEEKLSAPSAATSSKIVIVGAGIAGLSAAESAREAAPDAEIILLSAEEELPYYRLNLTRYLAGEMTDDELPIHPKAWYEERSIEIQLGKRLQGLSATDKTIVLADGETVGYDQLIIATGAEPFVPPIPGNDLPHVHTLRTANDAKAILDAVRHGTHVVCIGGGILGLETAGALARQGANVTVLEASEHLMPRQLNAAGSDVISKHLYSLNIDVITQAETERIEPQTVELKDGSTVLADRVIITVGVRPSIGIFEDAGLMADRGLIVDNFMRTSNRDILVAGDACEHEGMMYGSWAAAQFQGKIAGMNAAGAPTEFGGIPRSHTLKILGKDMFSIGTITSPDESLRQIDDEPEDNYRLFTLQDGILVGALLVGDLSIMNDCRKAIENKVEVGPASSSAEIAEAIRSN